MSETTTQETTIVDDATSHPGTTQATETTPEASSPDHPNEAGSVRPANREARYRVERNEARQALDAAEALLGGYRTREVERLASEHLAQPSDLLSLGEVALTDLITDDGFVNPKAVSEAVSALIEARPGLAKTPPPARAVDRSQGQGGNVGRPKPSLGDVFKIN
jgi:hypothetical protein